MLGGYTTKSIPVYHSWCSCYCTLLLMFLILGQSTIIGASVIPLSSGGGGEHGEAGAQRELVGQDSSYCRYRRKILSCDFKWINKEVELPVRPHCKEDVERIFVRHVHNLRLNRGSCYHLSLTHVTSMTLAGNEVRSNCSCQNFRLQNTTAYDLPSSVANLYVHESHITNIALNTVLQQLTIIGSTIGELSFKSIINSTITVKLHSTTIDLISGFRLSTPASLFMQNCTVKKIPDGALVLGSGQNVLNQLRLGDGHNVISVISLNNGGDMTMENMEGKVKIKAESDDDSDTQLELDKMPTESIMQNVQYDTLCESNNSVVVIILVLFLLISIILNIALLIYARPRKLINKLFSKSNNNETIERNISDSLKISDKNESCESQSLINSISPAKQQLPENMNFPDVIQTNK
ncbi:unnamed protein product, partial [Meganyctiphanes norvegica]